jgi:hypothetical protein
MTAKRTLELEEGECGGHSRVLAAMLRSLGIPARTPMGGMYVPLYGGSFGQHMWTEVYMGGEIGWLPVDCTAGEATFIDAGHIRLSDVMVPFRPQSIEVLDHEPKAAAGGIAQPERRSDAYPYAAGETLTYAYTKAGRALGTEKVTYEGQKDGGHAFTGALDLGRGRHVETTRTVVGDDGRLISFQLERKSGEVETSLRVDVAANTAVIEKKSSEGARKDDVEVDPAVFPLHGNCTPHFAIVVSRFAGAVAPGAEIKVRLLMPEQRTSFAMTLRPQGTAEIAIGGKTVSALAHEVSLPGLTFTLHTDEAGRLLRFHQPQGDVTIELEDS